MSFEEFLADLVKYAKVYGQLVLARTGVPQSIGGCEISA